MDNDVKTKNNEEIAHFLNASDRMIKGIDVLRKKNRPLLNGHRYLTDDELSRLLHINRRTLQDYRNMGRISFVKFRRKGTLPGRRCRKTVAGELSPSL